ncbi:MAG: MFS transporter [Chloroflexi bacterium]|nr:MFS transporter [Chloroflexota bacterium]
MVGSRRPAPAAARRLPRLRRDLRGFALAGGIGTALLVVALYGACYGATERASRAFVTDLSGASERGNMFDWFHAVTAIGALPASVVAGALWSAALPAAAFLFGSAASMAAAALRFRIRALRRASGA